MTRLNKNQLALVSLLATSLLVGWRPFCETLALSWHDDEYTQILVILPISILLICLEGRFQQDAREWNFRSGPALLMSAVVVACFVRFWPASLSGDERLAIGMFALVVSWIGIFILCFGSKARRRVTFPLLLLFGLVPFPRAVLSIVIAILQQGSAWATHALFAVFGIPVVQQGVILTIPGLTIRVAQECSSIRSSSMLIVTTLVVAHVLLRSPWRKALVIGLAVPFSIAKNGLRIFTIAMLGTRVDSGYLTGRLHHQGGSLFFLIALIGLFAVVWILRRNDRPMIEHMESPQAVTALDQVSNAH